MPEEDELFQEVRDRIKARIEGYDGFPNIGVVRDSIVEEGADEINKILGVDIDWDA